MSTQIAALKDKAEKAKLSYNSGLIDRETAKAEIKPYIDAVNTRSKELAKKYNQRAKLINLTGFLR